MFPKWQRESTVLGEAARAIQFRAGRHLSADEGTRLMRELARVRPGVQVSVDVRGTEHFEDYAIARLAYALQTRDPVGVFIGLPSHHLRLLEYLGIRCKAATRSADSRG